MRALCSKIKKHDFFIISLGGVLENGHFKNVQKPFSALRPDPNIFLFSISQNNTDIYYKFYSIYHKVYYVNI